MNGESRERIEAGAAIGEAQARAGIRTAIFDADGTLLDSMKIWEEAGSRYLRDRGIHLSRADAGMLSDVLYPMTMEEGAAYLKERWNLPEPAEEIKAGVVKVIENFYRQEVTAKAGVAEFLGELQKRGIPMGIATTGDRALLTAALERLGLDGYFQGILTCTELATSKREPLIFEKGAELLGSPVAKTWVFEDTLTALTTARRAGFRTAAVEEETSAGDREQIRDTADYYMKDFRDFERFWRAAGG